MQPGEIEVLVLVFGTVGLLAWFYFRKLRAERGSRLLQESLTSGFLQLTLERREPEAWSEALRAFPHLVTDDRAAYLVQQCGQNMLHGQLERAERLAEAASACWTFQDCPAWNSALSLADMWRRLDKMERAEQVYLRLEKHAPMELFVRMLRGWLYLLYGRREEAWGCLQAAWENASPGSAEPRGLAGVSLCVAAVENERWEEARAGIEGAANSRDWKALAEPLRALLSAAQTSDHAGVSTAYLHLAEAFFMRKFWFQSVYCYRKAVEHNPQNLDAVRNLGDGYFAQGMTLESVEWYRQALALTPNAPSYRFLGHALARLGRLDEAIEATREALRVCPDYREAVGQLKLLEKARQSGGFPADPLEWPA